MVYKRFNSGIIILAILMAIVSYAFVWSLYREYQLVTSVSLLLVFISLIIAMIWHVSRTNRELTRFLLALQFDDTSNLFDTDNTRGTQKKLFESFNKIILDFQALKIKKEREQSLLDSTFEQPGPQ
jgi:two-component system nitrogen regulation sensor histidine kinase NtrY